MRPAHPPRPTAAPRPAVRASAVRSALAHAAAAGSCAALLLAGCGGPAAPSAQRSGTAPAASADAATAGASAGPTPTPSGPPTPTAGEGAAAFWARRQVVPPPPQDVLDAYDALPLPTVRGSVPDRAGYVRAALRELSGEAYALDHLRLDLVDAGVLGTTGLSGDDRSILQAHSIGLTATTTTLQAVTAAAVVALSPQQARALDADIVVLTLRYGPQVGTVAGGARTTLPAAAPQTEALAGHLVTSALLGTYFYVTSAVDCATATAGSASAAACATL